MRVKIISTIILVVLYSCNKNPIEKEEYNTDGTLKSSSFFKTEQDSFPYKMIVYQNDGVVSKINLYDNLGNFDGVCYEYNSEKKYKKNTSYVRGVREGDLIVEFEDGRKVTQPYKNDTIHGVEYRFTNGIVNSEIYWNRGVPIAERDIDYFSKGDSINVYEESPKPRNEHVEIAEESFAYVSYYLLFRGENGLYAKEPMGYLQLNEEGIDTSYPLNSYHNIVMPDTIVAKDTLKVDLSYYDNNFDGECYLRIDIGKFNKELNLEVPYKSLKVDKGVQNFSFNYMDYEGGYNILMGRVSLVKGNNILSQSIIFEDFHVLPASSDI